MGSKHAAEEQNVAIQFELPRTLRRRIRRAAIDRDMSVAAILRQLVSDDPTVHVPSASFAAIGARTPGGRASAMSADERGDMRGAVVGRIDLVVLLTDFGVALTSRGGGRRTGLCLFHAERTPSFIVHANDGEPHFHCYGCGVVYCHQ